MDQTTRIGTAGVVAGPVDAAVVRGWVQALQPDLSRLDDAARGELIPGAWRC